MAGEKLFLVDGVAYNAVQIRDLLIDAYDLEREDAVEFMIGDIERHVQRTIDNTTNRGVGFQGVLNYNNPLEGTRVRTERQGDKTLVYVEGRIWNILDKGRKGFSKPPDGRPYTFPGYNRGKTTTKPNSTAIRRGGTQMSGQWVKTYSVDSVKPRQFMEKIVERVQKRVYERPPVREKRTRNPFRWRFSGKELEIKVVEVKE